ncbi:MAG: hypothetical protein KatS3mg113_0953 [Planctomycetaceae bacterium]|nr:MAG: hypothetical protein KatS3mg113_0953 [Planctomycetaceae bacterium]
MNTLLTRFVQDEAGFLISSEMILIACLVILGSIVGLATVRDQVTTELADLGDAVSQLNQSYSFSSLQFTFAFPNATVVGSIAGSSFNDQPDFCAATATPGAQGTGPGDGVCLDFGPLASDE